METITVQIGWSGNNFEAIIKDFFGVVVATHKTLKGIKKEIQEAFYFHVEGLVEDGENLPRKIRAGKVAFKYVFMASAKLKILDGVVTRSALAKASNVNERQLGHYIQGKREARPETQKKIDAGIKKISKDLLQVV